MGPGKAFGAYFDDWRAVNGAETLSDSVPLPLVLGGESCTG